MPNIAYVSDGTLKEGKHRGHQHQEKWLDHDRNGVGQGNGYFELAPSHTGNGSAYRQIGNSKHNGWDLNVTLEKQYQNLPYVPANPNVFQFGGYQRKALSQVKPHEEVEPVEYDHPARRLIENPNPWDTWFDFSYERQMFLELCGVNYTWAVPNDYGIPCELWCIPAHWVWPRTGGARYVPPDNPHADELIQYYEVRPWGGMGSAGIIKIPPNEIIMEYWKSPINKIDGYSKLSAQAMAIDLEESIEKCNWSQMQNQALPSVFVELPPDFEDPDDARAKRLQARFMDHLQGEYNVGKPFVGLAGMKLTPLSFSPEQMMYGQTKEQIRDQILSAFRVPGAAVGLVKDMTYGSVLSTLAAFCQGCIDPRLTMLGQKWTKDLMSKFQRGERFNDNRRSIRLWYDSCHDTETECLTSNGWKRQDELTKETRIACYDDVTNTIIYRKPKRIIRHQHDGDLCLWEGQRVNAAMTPDHRVWVRPRQSKRKAGYEIDTAGGLNNSWDYGIMRAAPAACDVPIPVEVKRYAGGHQQSFDGMDTIDPKLWLEFIGYYISEGNLTRNDGNRKKGCGPWQITISQNDDSDAFDRIERCIESMPFGNWKTYRKYNKDRDDSRQMQFVCTDRGMYYHLKRHCGKGSLNKKIPDYVKAWPAEYLKVLLDALIAGDGWKPRVNANTGVWSSGYTTISKQLADDVQEIAIKCGLSAVMRSHRPYTHRSHSYYTLNLSSRVEAYVHPHDRRVIPYSGIVWCVEVPTGKFVVRRNGKVHITGNCVPHDPQQINSDIQLDYSCAAISPNEIRALRGRKPWPYGGDNPMVQGPGGLQPLPWNKKEELDKDVADLLGYYHQHASGQEASQESQMQAQQGQNQPRPGSWC